MILNYNKVIEMMHKLEIDIFPVIIADRCHGVFANLPRVISGRTAVLMLDSLGSRLKPYTDKTPKPLLKLSGVSILDHILDKLTKYGFNKIIMCLNYKSEQFIEKYTKDKRPLEYIFVEEPKRLGTGGALSLIKDFTSEDEDILVMNGD